MSPRRAPGAADRAGGRAGSEAPEDLAAQLNEMCRAVVGAVRSGDPRRAAALRPLLADLAGRASPAASFYAALARVLDGEEGATLAVDLPPPWDAALRAVGRDLQSPAAGAPATVDWVAALADRVARLLTRRDRVGARRLADELAALAGQPGLPPDAAAYVAVLQGALAGRDVRTASLDLAEPYRTAYLSLLAVVRGADPRAGVIERVRDNAILAIRAGDADLRARLAAALDEVAADASHAGQPDVAAFVASVARRLRGHEGAAAPFAAPDLAAAWDAVAAAEGASPR